MLHARNRIAAAAGWLAAILAPAAADGWTTYVNGRFGTSALVPLDLFPESGVESANGDGATFRSADGAAVLLIWASHNLDDLSPTDMLAAAREGEGVVSAEAAIDGYALRAESGSRGWFERCTLGHDAGSVIHCFRLEFPAGEAASYAAAGERIGASLRGP